MRGSIRRRGKASFEIQIELTGENGKRRRRFVSVKGTYKDAQRELSRLLAAADTGTLPDPSSASVAAYVCAWLDGATQVSPRTFERYRELAAKQIVPHLGATKLQKLRPEHVRQWHGTLLGTGLSARTVGHAHRLLSLVLKSAVASNTLPRNVAAIHAPPRVEERELEILSPEQIADVRAKLVGRTPLAEIVELALATGMRRGEVLGVMWGDIDLDRGTLRVERSVEETRAGLRLKAPKTKRGRRNITLPSEAVSVLRAHKIQLLELRFALGMGPITPSTLVFSTVDGELIRPRNISKAWSRVVTGKGFHSLRHTHASMLINAGVDILTISRRLGHSKAAITLDTYGHLIEGADAAAAKAIEGVLK